MTIKTDGVKVSRLLGRSRIEQPSADSGANVPITKTILITGGAGFIGSNLVRHLHAKHPQFRLLVLDALTYAGHVHNLPHWGRNTERLEFWYGNVCNGELVDALVSRADAVIHLAAESSVTRSIYDNRLFFETDVIGTQTVANAVTRYRERIDRFIHISTSEVYGTAVAPKMDEDHPLNPMSPYAAAKCGADRLVWSYWTTYGIPAVIVRPFNNFGPYQHLEKVVPRFITNCLLDEPLRVHGAGEAARDFLFVQDHCEALERLLLVPRARIQGKVINLGTEQHRSILQIAQTVREMMDAEHVPIQCVGDRPGQVVRHTADAGRARDLLDWTPRTSWEDGLRQTIEWYSENEWWWQTQLGLREIPIITATGVRELH
jgi:dTDP-glucose 4,6-dehydratase